MSARRAVLLSTMSALVACGGAEQAPAAEQGPRVTVIAPDGAAPLARADEPEAPPRERGPVELTPIPGGDGPGAAYFVINTLGVARLDEAGATLLLDKPERNLQDLFVGPDGAVYLLDARSLRKLVGDAFVEVRRFEFEDVAPVDALALAPDGTIWTTGSRGLGRHDGERWTISAREQLGLGYSSEVAVGFDGEVWLTSGTKLLRRAADEQELRPVDTKALGRAPLLLHLSASPAKFVVATNGQQLIRMDGEQLELTPLPGAEAIGYTAELALAANGTIALASGTCELVRLGPDGRGEAWRFGRDGYACESLEAMAIDARSRIWVASREGLSVIDEQGQVTEYPSGSFAALAGRVSHIVVVGRGPELPPAPELATATLTGAILVDGKPLAKAKLELCPSVRLVEQGSPCAEAKRRYPASTDGRGRFRIEQVAIGDYSVAVEVDGQWRWTSPPSFAAQLRPGEVHELGALALAKL